MPLPKAPSWALKSKSCGDMEPELDNGTYFKTCLTDTWVREHGTEWMSHIPYPYQASLPTCSSSLL